MAAARPSYSLGMTRPKSLVVSLTGSVLEAFIAGTLKLTMLERVKILGMSLNAGAVGGTYSVATVDVKIGSTSLLGAAFDVAALVAGTVIHKEVADLAAGAADVAKGSEISVVQAVTGGSSPTWRLVTLQIDVIPLGD